MYRVSSPGLGISWLIHAGALLLHVYDEATHNFLSYYNPIVRNLRGQLPVLPIPTFTYELWLTGLIVGVAILFALSPFAFRKKIWIQKSALILGSLMIVNGILHLAGSLILGILFPGVISSPILMIAAGNLIWHAHQPGHKREQAKS